jgi:hypothetical protein
MAFAKNTRTGKFVNVPDHYIGHPVFGGDLILVDSESTVKPVKEKKKKNAAPKMVSMFTQAPAEFETPEEQPAPETNIEDEENEDGN